MSEQYLKQIDSMARQIEQSHSALRKRNATIEALREEVKFLKSHQCVIEVHDGLEAWNSGYLEGKKHGKRIATAHILRELDEADSICGEWAIAVIAGDKK